MYKSPSHSYLAVEETVSGSFCDVVRFNIFRPFQIGYGTGKFQNPGTSPCRQSQSFNNFFKQAAASLVKIAERFRHLVVHSSIAEYIRTTEPYFLNFPCSEDPPGNGFARFGPFSLHQQFRIDGMHPNLQVNSVHDGT